MLYSIILFLSLMYSLIVKDSIENIFIIVASLMFYKVVIIDKNLRDLLYGFIISFIGINLIILFVIKDPVAIKNADPVIEDEKTLVLLVSEGEDKHYNIRERATQVYKYEGYKSFYNSISHLNKYKSYYQNVGVSNFKKRTVEIAEKLNFNLGNNYIVANSYLFSKPYFEQMMEVIIQDGYKEIIICPLFMTEGKDYQDFIERYEEMELASRNIINVKTLKPLYDEDDLADLYTNDIIHNVYKLQNDAGVLLIGLEDKNNLEQDLYFRKEIERRLEEEKGELDIEIRHSLFENNEDDIIRSAQELLEYGIHSLYVVTPTNLVDTMYTKDLIETMLEKLELGNTSFYYINPPEKIDTIVDILLTQIHNIYIDR